MRLNREVSAYWLWLIVIGGILAVLPSVPYSSGKGSDGFLNVAFLYRDALRGDTRSWSAVGDGLMILLHAVVSVVLAVIAAVVYQSWAKRRRPQDEPDSRNFTLGDLLWLTTIVAIIFGVLASFGAIAPVYVAVLLFATGRFVTSLAVAIRL